MLRPLGLLWLFGICLRLTVLAIPPVIPMIHESLRLTQAQVGALTSLPVLLFSFAAVPGAVLIARFGAASVLTGGILLAGIASALRGASFDAATLFAATFVMGVGIAVMQPALPTIVGEWLPRKIGLGTAVFTNGLLVGEALSASLTIPWVLPAVHGSWRLSLVAWSIPVVVIAGLSALNNRGKAARAPAKDAAPQLWWPDWRSPVTWRLGFIAGGSSSIYFAANAFLPDYLKSMGRSELIGPALSTLNWMQIPASILLLAFSDRLMLRRWPFLATGVVSCMAVVGLMTAHSAWIVVWSGAIGFSSAFILTLSLALPPMLAPARDVHRMSAAIFAIGYLCALVTPVAGGFAWDITGIPRSAFVPAGSLGILIIVLSLGLVLRENRAPVPAAD
jgi:MFS transporter, CP family, cyanate transporter